MQTSFYVFSIEQSDIRHPVSKMGIFQIINVQ